MPAGRVLSVNVGQPRQVPVAGGAVLTAFVKSPVPGRIPLRGYNFDGDRQADLVAHGGKNKAVYLYASERYAFWAEQLPDANLAYGAFGENLTTEGLLEEEVRIGDQFRVGTAVIAVAQPRMPCYKLNIRFGRPDMVKLFWQSGYSGIYFSIVEEGDVAAGDSIVKVAEGPLDISIADVIRLYRGDETDPAKWDRAMQSPLRGSWKTQMEENRRERARAERRERSA